MNKLLYGGAVVLVAVAAGAFWWWQQSSVAPPAEPAPGVAAPAPEAPASMAASAPEAPLAAASSPETIRFPVEASAPAVPPASFETRLGELLGRAAVLNFLQTDQLIRRVVVTVDNLARHHAAPQLWPVHPMPGRFTVEGEAGAGVIAAANAERYQPWVDWVTRVPVQPVAALYRQAYPAFQQRYEELGYPGRYFNDRLIDVIDHLLATPEPAQPLAVQLTEVKGPVAPVRPWVRYEFSDPQLERLSAGQKMLLRVSPAQARALKAKLGEFRRELAGAP